MLVTAQNNAKPAGGTEATVFGPFYVEGAPVVENGADLSNGALSTTNYCVVAQNGYSVGGILVMEGLARTWTGKRRPWCDHAAI